jgi:hypothetical protein
MRKEMPVIPVNTVVDKKRIIRKNGGPRRRTGTRSHSPPTIPPVGMLYRYKYRYR